MVPIKQKTASRTNYGGKRTQKVEWIVMHYTANDGDSDEANGNYFANNKNLGASAHYFVDDDSITASVPEDCVAWHCGAKSYRHPKCRNENSIGIEMCDTKRDGKVMATEQTVENAAELAALLCRKYDISYDHIIRHYDVTGKKCPAYWIGNDGLEKFRNMVKECIRMQTRFKTLNDVPQSLRAEAKKLIDSGALKGKGAAGLDVTEDMLRCLIISMRYADTK